MKWIELGTKGQWKSWLVLFWFNEGTWASTLAIGDGRDIGGRGEQDAQSSWNNRASPKSPVLCLVKLTSVMSTCSASLSFGSFLTHAGKGQSEPERGKQFLSILTSHPPVYGPPPISSPHHQEGRFGWLFLRRLDFRFVPMSSHRRRSRFCWISSLPTLQVYHLINPPLCCWNRSALITNKSMMPVFSTDWSLKDFHSGPVAYFRLVPFFLHWGGWYTQCCFLSIRSEIEGDIILCTHFLMFSGSMLLS